MQMERNGTSVIVVGGGMAGLASAAYLARDGAQVTLFERASALGGRAASQSFDGYVLNMGAHALYTGGDASDVLRELGVPYGHGTPKPVYVLKAGQTHLLPASVASLLRTDLLDWGDKVELGRLFVALPLMSTRDLANVTVAAWVARAVQRPGPRALLCALARTLTFTDALDLVSADLYVERLRQTMLHPIHYVDGGWQRLVDGMRHVAEQAGVRIESGARVAEIALEQGRVTGVHLTDGRMVTASQVIVAAKREDAARLLRDVAAPEWFAALDAMVPSQLACLDVALRHLPRPSVPVVMDEDCPRFVTAQSLFARVAPAGGAVVHAFKELDPRHPTDPRADERELEQLLDVTQPGWHDLLVRRVYLPRIEASSFLPTAESGGMAARPDARVVGADGLYVAGDWVGSEGYLLDAGLASARRAARLALADARHEVPAVARSQAGMASAMR